MTETQVKSVTGGHDASVICMNAFMSDDSHVIWIQLREHHLALMCLQWVLGIRSYFPTNKYINGTNIYDFFCTTKYISPCITFAESTWRKKIVKNFLQTCASQTFSTSTTHKIKWFFRHRQTGWYSNSTTKPTIFTRKKTKSCFAFDAEFTRRPKWFIICDNDFAASFFELLLVLQLLKSCNM